MGYQVSDSLSRVVNSTYTPTVVPPPTASGDGSQGVKGQPQTIALITNDVPGDGVAPLDPTTIRLCDSSETAPNCTRQSLTISGEGTYTINPSGTVTFTPDPDFVGSSTPQRYVVADVLGQVTDATIQPNVVPPPAPITADDSETGPADTPMTIDPLVNDSAGTLPAGLSGDVNLVRSSLRLCDRNELAPNCTATQLTTADGTYTVDTATGFVTFTPRQGFSGVVTQPVTYQIANDWTGPSGIGIATAVITVIIDPAAPPVVPPTLPLAETTSVGLPATGADSVVLALWGVVILGLGGLLMVIHQRAQRNNESV
jgi:LPXTG-motif cell wall-anchored protein